MGIEWLVDATGCAPRALADPATLQHLFSAIVGAAELTPVGDARWHQFPEGGGITVLLLLGESHLTCHTFPENGTLCLNLFCCRPRPDWEPERLLREYVGADRVHVRTFTRYVKAEAPMP